MPVLAVALAVALPHVLTMDDALKLFRERGFDLLLADAQLASAQADERAAHAVANPQLGLSLGKSFGYDPNACQGCSATAFSASLTDPSALSDLFTGKRGLRIDVAQAAVRAAQSSREDALRTLTLTLRQAMLDGALQAAQAEVARNVAESSQHTLQLDQKRYALGAISEAELARIEVATLEAEQARETAGQQGLAARLQVAYLLGARDAEPDFSIDASVLGEPMPSLPPDEAQLVQSALGGRPDVRALQAQVERATEALSLARRQRVPDFAIDGQYNQEGTGPDALQPPTVTVGLSFTLPIFYQQQGEIEKAAADLRTQEIALEKARATAVLEVRVARSAVEANRKLLGRMQERLLERAGRARDLAQVQYEKGAASLLDFLDAQRTWAQIRAEYLKDLHDFWLATWQLDAALGKS